MKTYRNILFSFSIYLLISCQSENKKVEFNSKKWQSYEQGIYNENYRKKMVFDLVYNHLDTRMNNQNKIDIKEIKKLLGFPIRIDTLTHYGKFYFVYEVEEKNEYNIDPNGGMNLELHFDQDSILTYWKINEFWFKP